MERARTFTYEYYLISDMIHGLKKKAQHTPWIEIVFACVLWSTCSVSYHMPVTNSMGTGLLWWLPHECRV